jgi:signal recognition particle receptor subunit beta
MVQFNFNERTIKAKVVYYGPAQSGKTTNLEQIHRLTDPGGTQRLISLNTAQDRTLFFDLLPFSLGAVSGYDFQVQLYTVPGQVQYNATRRVVLAGADAVVFVADSRRAFLKENVAALENMKVNLLANRLVPEKVPLVFQYNKQDLPDLLPLAELDAALNAWARPTFAAVAAGGQGVMETFLAVVQGMLGAIAQKYNLKDKGLDPESVPDLVSAAFSAVLDRAASAGVRPNPPAGPRVIVSQPPDASTALAPQTPEAGLVSEELLHRAIRSNVELAEALGDLVRHMNVGLASILSHAELSLIYKDESREKRAGAIQSIHTEAQKLRGIVQRLGAASSSAAASGPAAAPAPAPAAPPTPTPAPAPARTPAALPAPDGLESLVRAAVARVQQVLDGRGLAFTLRIAPGTGPPRGPAETVPELLAGVLEGVASASAPRSSMSLRCERKPVLMRSREGEVRQDFLMLAVSHQGSFPADEQQQVMDGAGTGPLGGAARRVRALGGFVRFAPLPGGALETRVFLPTA